MELSLRRAIAAVLSFAIASPALSQHRYYPPPPGYPPPRQRRPIMSSNPIPGNSSQQSALSHSLCAGRATNSRSRCTAAGTAQAQSAPAPFGVSQHYTDPGTSAFSCSWGNRLDITCHRLPVAGQPRYSPLSASTLEAREIDVGCVSPFLSGPESEYEPVKQLADSPVCTNRKRPIPPHMATERQCSQ